MQFPEQTCFWFKPFFFANQGKAEAAITELLVGLSYVCRYGREHNRKPLWKSAGTKS